MKALGFFLLLAGWLIVLAALAVIGGLPLNAFILAGVGVEVLGLSLVIRSHLVPHRDGA
jgi:hypothetical protein